MRISKVFPALFLAMGVCAPVAFSQPTDEIKGLRRDMDAVRDSLKVIQNQIEELKKLVQQPAAAPQPPAFREATINIDGAPFLGKKDAKVTLIEFSDYQCPFCARSFQQTFPQIREEYIKTGKVKYVFRDYPLEQLHPHAFKASEAARCGGDQGKYWDMHDKLFNNQTKLAPDDLMSHAQEAGLDTAKFKACLDGGKQAEKVRKDQAEGRNVGVSGTPAFFLGLTQPNESTVKAVKKITGAQPYASFKDGIEELLK